MITQTSAPTPTKDPLTTQDRQIIATIVNQSDYSKECKPEDVVTIWITEDGTTVWVKMIHGYARYHKEQFKRAVAEIKTSLSAPVKRNQQLDEELKQAADKISLLGDCDWLSLSIQPYPDKVIGYAGCYTSQKPRILTSLAQWDFTPLKWNMPAAICPDCDGHGCGNCSYRGTRAEDLCTPVDGYRFTYVGRTHTQTAHNVYLDGEFLGILFKVRNADEVWENDTKTYYWRCGDGVQYWSVKEAVEVLSRATAPIEMPQVCRELIAA
ncbi:hypothetical protein ANSO36C_64900 (plasmid) [Nostoc cf. commune SO-36]|uniref:Uncharacterized protein n=1 Tax=Nostoc cf. commune SO-36 TaxID=449208 RepID=A0ABN6QGR6_NOSCO|nr:hypothetical protein [Nostoc commune]BDI20688.1 hypothetical protein ANSO36C_64900 [Nostoc cf. commune SO-36]